MRYTLFTLAWLLYLLVWLMEMISYICVLLIAAMNHISVSFQIHHLKSQGSRYYTMLVFSTLIRSSSLAQSTGIFY